MDDNSFGPRLLGHFDFTILFEHTLFDIIPSAMIIFATPFYIYKIIRGTALIRPGLLLCAKLLITAALIGVQAASIGLWSVAPIATRVTSAAATLTCVSAVCIAIIVVAGHIYFIRPLPFLGLFLTVTMLLDIASTITYFNRDALGTIAKLHVPVPLLKLALLVLEEVSKRSLTRAKELRSSLGDEAYAGFWNRSLLFWVNSILLFGFRRNITIDTMPGLHQHLDAETLHRQFEPLWKSANKESKYALMRTCIRLMPWEFLYIILPRLLIIGFIFSQPFLLQDVVDAVSSTAPSEDVTRGLILATTIIYIGRAVSTTWYTTIRNHITTSIRGVLVTAIYCKTLCISSDESVQAAAVTLMNSDIAATERLFAIAHDTWGRALEICLGIAILAVYTGAASVFTLIPTIIAAVASTLLGRRLSGNRRIWNEHIEDRIATTSNMLAQMKDVKMLGISPALAEKLQAQAETEVDVSMRDRNAIAGSHTLTALAETVTPVLVIAGLLFWTRASDPLSPARFFTTLALVTMVSGPLSMIIATVPFAATGFASLVRVQEFLCRPEVADPRQFIQNNSSSNSAPATEPAATAAAASPSNVAGDAEVEPVAHATGVSNPQQNQQSSGGLVTEAIQIDHITVTMDLTGTVLRDVSFNLAMGCTTMIVGAVGIGKSTLLKAILGQMRLRSGTVALSSKAVAYCAQQPWIRATTIRRNIIGNKPFRAAIYRRIVWMCALDVDLAALADGDQTFVGLNGCNLSGGQRQRIALARAFYFEADIIVLDDVFSSLDRETSSTLRIRIFGGGGITESGMTTLVMTTSTRAHLVDADVVYEIDQDGRLAVLPESQYHNEPAPTQNSTGTAASASQNQPSVKSEYDLLEVQPSTEPNTLPDIKYGDFSLWRFYFGPAGLLNLLYFVIIVALGALAERLPQIYSKIWLDRHPKNSLFFIGYALLGVLNPILNWAGSMIFYHCLISTAAKTLHKRLSGTLASATFEYVTSENPGSILNKFSQDHTMATQTLPLFTLPSAWIGAMVLIDIGIIAAGASYASPIIPFLIFVIFLLQYFYLRTSRQVRAIELDSSKTLVQQFTETGTGLDHVRAFHWEAEFVAEFHEALTQNQKPFYLLLCIQQWLATVLDFTTAISAITIVSLALSFTKATSSTSMGLALLTLITFSDTMRNFVLHYVAMEVSYASVARIRAFDKNTPKETQEEDVEDLTETWPEAGRVEFRSVSATYRAQSLSPQRALQNVSLVVQPGETISLTGRTGSGKSSVILTLLRLLEYSGTITIDGRDISTIPHDVLRSRITTITQSGLQLKGTVRFNLNPCSFTWLGGNLPNDESYAGVLRRVGLWGMIQRRGGLDAPMSAMKFSTGQKQLFQLARAMLHKQLRRSKIVLIDEGTSSLDADTEQQVAVLVDEVFAECTKVIISHRPALTENADLLLRLEHGYGEVRTVGGAWGQHNGGYFG